MPHYVTWPVEIHCSVSPIQLREEVKEDYWGISDFKASLTYRYFTCMHVCMYCMFPCFDRLSAKKLPRRMMQSMSWRSVSSMMVHCRLGGSEKGNFTVVLSAQNTAASSSGDVFFIFLCVFLSCSAFRSHGHRFDWYVTDCTFVSCKAIAL